MGREEGWVGWRGEWVSREERLAGEQGPEGGQVSRDQRAGEQRREVGEPG